jgi:hypothetical protein
MHSTILMHQPGHIPPEIPAVPNPQPDIEPSRQPQPELPEPPDVPGLPATPATPEIIPDPGVPEIPPLRENVHGPT